MQKHILGKLSATVCALAALGALPAHAGQSPFNPAGNASQLGPGTVFTQPYPDNNGFAPNNLQQNVGGTTVTFTATNEPANGNFESFRNQASPTTGVLAFDFAPNTQLLNTFDPNTHNPTGPLLISFGSGVSSFGLSAQSGGVDFEQFTVTTNLGTFTTPTFDNTMGSGKSVFLGAQATNGDLFTSVTITSLSTVNGKATTFTNDFYFGPLGIAGPNVTPVPEASSAAGLGVSLLLFGGLAAVARRKRAARAA